MYQVCPRVFADFYGFFGILVSLLCSCLFLDVWHDIEEIVCGFVVLEGFPIELGLSGLLIAWGWNRRMLYRFACLKMTLRNFEKSTLGLGRSAWFLLGRGIFHGLWGYTDGYLWFCVISWEVWWLCSRDVLGCGVGEHLWIDLIITEI